MRVKLIQSFFVFFLASVLAFSVSAFEVYDEVRFSNKPDLTQYRFSKLRMIYTGSFWKTGEDKRLLPPRQRVFDFVNNKYANYGGFLVPDIEHWSFRGSDAQIAASVTKYLTLLGWIKSAAPNAMVGYYARPPLRDYHRAKLDPSAVRYQEWQKHNDRLAPLANAQDAFFPSLYTFDDNQTLWVKAAIGNVSEAKRLGNGKPVCVYINPYYHQAAYGSLANQPIPKDYFLLQLQTLKKYADCAVIWSGKRIPWNEQASWWLATKEFLSAN